MNESIVMNITENITNTLFQNQSLLNGTNTTSVNNNSGGINVGTIILIFLLFSFLKKIQMADSHNWKVIKTEKVDERALDKVIGLKTVKKEIEYYMDFIKNKKKYLKWKVKLPKGILLAGPPGTGKTLLIKAISKKLGIPLITASGAEFVEKYVGVGRKAMYYIYR